MKYLKKINESVENNITLVVGDDWQGVYFNNELIDQGHSPNFENVLKKLGYNLEYISIEQEEIWDELGGSCPQNLEEVKLKLDTEKYNL